MTSTLPPGLTRLAAPAYEPLTLAEAKLYLRVDHPEDDRDILRLITSARETAEEYLRRSLVTQDWRLEREDGLSERTRLPRGPVQSILSVEVLNADGSVQQTLSPGLYRLAASRRELVADTCLAARTRIAYRAGYGNAESVPAVIRQGILAHVGALYEGGILGGLPEHCEHLYAPYREVSL